MSTSAPAAAGTNGLPAVVDTIVAPSDAFERLRVAPTWGWALIAALVLMLVGAYLQGPAARHAAVVQTQTMMNNSTFFANVPAEKKQEAVANAGKPNAFSYIGPVFVLFFAVFFNALILLIANAAGRGQADFKRLWCGSMNIAVPTLGLGAIVLGVIAMVRGADSFNSSLDIARAVPSLASLVPHASATLSGFLSAISIFSLWGLFLNATMMRVTAKMSPTASYVSAAIVTLLGACIAAGGIAVAHGFGAA
jgi:hypothetical protein